MMLTRSMAARRTPLPLPHDMAVEIAARVAATSLRPMQDICSLRSTCQTMHAACKEGVVRSCIALEREEAMRWFKHDRYLALVDNLAAAGNPEACFVLGLKLVFVQQTSLTAAPAGIDWLRRAAAAGHKVAAYVLGVLHYGDKKAEQYIREVEGEMTPNEYSCKAYKTNRECVRCRTLAIHAVQEVTWKGDEIMGPTPVPLSAMDGGQESCKGSGCGVPEGWVGDGCAVFCSDSCRIRHEYFKFFSRVSLHVTY